MAQNEFRRGQAFLRQDVSDHEGGATAAGGPRRRVCVSRAEPGCGGARVLGLGSWRPSATAMSEGDRRGGGLGHLWAVGGSEGLAGRRAGSRPAV